MRAEFPAYQQSSVIATIDLYKAGVKEAAEAALVALEVPAATITGRDALSVNANRIELK